MYFDYDLNTQQELDGEIINIHNGHKKYDYCEKHKKEIIDYYKKYGLMETSRAYELRASSLWRILKRWNIKKEYPKFLKLTDDILNDLKILGIRETAKKYHLKFESFKLRIIRNKIDYKKFRKRIKIVITDEIKKMLLEYGIPKTSELSGISIQHLRYRCRYYNIPFKGLLFRRKIYKNSNY